MNRSELVARAAPACRTCGEPVQRVEMPWFLDGEDWRLGQAVMVCAHGHRTPVEPL